MGWVRRKRLLTFRMESSIFGGRDSERVEGDHN
jgi:hypothetical protein